MRRHSSALSMFIASAALALLAAACASDSAEDILSQTPTVPSTEQPSPTLRPVIRTTGIPDLDAIFAALLSGDREAIRPLLHFEPKPCLAEPDDLSGFYVGGPPCRDAETDGTMVEVLRTSVCEGSFSRRDRLNEFLFSLRTLNQLYAVYEAPPNSGSEYFALVSAREGTMNVRIADGQIVELNFGCGPLSPHDFIDFYQLKNAVLPPP